MKGTFKPKFTKDQIEKGLKAKLERIEQAIIYAFQRVGETFVANAREMGAYKDQTGNLRSSVGYIVMKKGLQLTSGGFVKIKANKSSGAKLAAIIEGPTAGKALAEKLQKQFASKYKNAIVLIGVAGMHYALYVESKSRDVISGSSQIATKQLQEAIERIRTKVEKQ